MGCLQNYWKNYCLFVGEISTTSVRNNLHSFGQPLEDELGEEKGVYIEGCARDWEELPRPDLPLVLGMDGGYVRFYDKESKKAGNFEIIVGKSVKADGTTKRFGGVYCYDTKPQRRIFEVLKSQGMLRNQQVTFLSDGDDKIRELQSYLNPNAEYLCLLVPHHYAVDSDESNSKGAR